MRINLLSFLLILFSFPVWSQNNIIDDEVLLLEYLKKEKFEIDPTAAAITLFNKGHLLISDGGHVSYKVEKTIKILGNEGLKLSDVMIPTVSGSYSRKLTATAYNLDNGQIVKQKIEKNDVLDEKLSRNLNLTKFNIPSVKEGTIIHYTYTIEHSNISYDIFDWYFQEEFPSLYSEYSIALPIIIDYQPLVRSNVPMVEVNNINELGQHEGSSYASIILERQSQQVWVRTNIAALKEEVFANADEHRERVKIHLKGIGKRGIYHKINADWSHINNEYTESNTLFGDVFDRNRFLNQQTEEITNGLATDLDKAKAIYKYVRDEITLNEQLYEGFENRIRKVHTSKIAGRRGMNLYLTALLRNAGLESYPMAISQRGTEKMNDYFPDPTIITHAISMVTIENTTYYLDATNELRPFGELAPVNYNGYARIFKKQNGSTVELEPNLILNSSVSTVQIEPDLNESNRFNLKMDYYPSREESYYLRKKMKSDSLFIDKEFETFFNSSIPKVELTDFKIDHAWDPDSRLKITISGNQYFDGKIPDVLYMDVYFDKFFDTNPFPHMERKLPIDLNYKENLNYIYTFKIPDGYEVDEYPESLALQLGTNRDVEFNNVVNVNQNEIKIHTQFKVNSTRFAKEEYEHLRALYSRILEEYNKRVTLKRI